MTPPTSGQHSSVNDTAHHWFSIIILQPAFTDPTLNPVLIMYTKLTFSNQTQFNNWSRSRIALRLLLHQIDAAPSCFGSVTLPKSFFKSIFLLKKEKNFIDTMLMLKNHIQINLNITCGANDTADQRQATIYLWSAVSIISLAYDGRCQ
jgi:hypothetical protein